MHKSILVFHVCKAVYHLTIQKGSYQTDTLRSEGTGPTLARALRSRLSLSQPHPLIGTWGKQIPPPRAPVGPRVTRPTEGLACGAASRNVRCYGEQGRDHLYPSPSPCQFLFWIP